MSYLILLVKEGIPSPPTEGRTPRLVRDHAGRPSALLTVIGSQTEAGVIR